MNSYGQNHFRKPQRKLLILKQLKNGYEINNSVTLMLSILNLIYCVM